MTSQIHVKDSEIRHLFHEMIDEEIKGSESETEDIFLECKVQSDAKNYGEVSAPRVVSEDVFETASPSVPSFIILPQRQILRGKNDHRWTVTKGTTTNRVSCSNIIRTFRDPTRMNKCLYESLQCFSIFIIDDIVKDIKKWTNAEIHLKIQRYDVKATFKTTDCKKIGLLPAC